MTKIRSRNASRIEDRRGAESGGLGGLGDVLGGSLGRGGGGGGGFPLPGGLVKGGGGLIGLLIIAAVILLIALVIEAVVYADHRQRIRAELAHH